MLKPIGDRVIIEVAQEEEKTAGGFVLASAAKEKPQTGKVIAVGTGLIKDNGQTVPMTVKVNDTVLFEKYAGTETKYQGKDYLIIRENDIMAIVE